MLLLNYGIRQARRHWEFLTSELTDGESILDWIIEWNCKLWGWSSPSLAHITTPIIDWCRQQKDAALIPTRSQLSARGFPLEWTVLAQHFLEVYVAVFDVHWMTETSLYLSCSPVCLSFSRNMGFLQIVTNSAQEPPPPKYLKSRTA
jgi:hypothetical protein